MIYEFTIPFRLPGLNEYTKLNRGNRYGANKKKQELEQKIGWIAMSQLGGVEITEKVKIEYLWVEENRRRDLDNISFAKKFIQDALVKVGILRNDGWNEIAFSIDRFEVDKGNPRVEVKITEVFHTQTE